MLTFTPLPNVFVTIPRSVIAGFCVSLIGVLMVYLRLLCTQQAHWLMSRNKHVSSMRRISSWYYVGNDRYREAIEALQISTKMTGTPLFEKLLQQQAIIAT
uniref:Uncharacterized protein n=1 Tax=Anopheles dirus TaxID=7168 RepID=A0A182NWM1_9DIPT